MSNSLAVPSQCNGCPKSEMATALFGDEDEVRFHNLLKSQKMASEVRRGNCLIMIMMKL